MSERAGDRLAVTEYIRKLEALAPGDPRTRALVEELAAAGRNSSRP